MLRRFCVIGIAIALLASAPAPGIATPSHGKNGEQWVARYNGDGNDDDDATAVAASPDGSTVFVLGDTSTGTYGPYDWATIAYDAQTGGVRWSQAYGSGGWDYSSALVVSPDSSRVFVTGWREGANATSDYATVAYDAVTGTPLWEKIYAPSTFIDGARDIGITPDGATVFVAGEAWNGDNWDYVTLAYDALSGTRLWLNRYDGPAHRDDDPWALAVSPDGSRIFVTGESYGTGDDYATQAIDSTTGTELWSARYNGPHNIGDVAKAVQVSPDGAKVFVTGETDAPDTANHFATVAYDAATGSILWGRRTNGQGYNEQADALAVSSDGSKVFVTGNAWLLPSADYEYGTVAYDAATGALLWRRWYRGPGGGNDSAYDVVMSEDGSTVMVTGGSVGVDTGSDYATVAYDASTGASKWVHRYNGPGNDLDTAYGMVLSPDGTTLFVTGTSDGGATRRDFATVAYGV